MMYHYLTLADGTGVAHSEMKPDGRVKVYIETPIDGGFKHVTCWLPDYRWEDADGYTPLELDNLRELVENNAHLIITFSQEGGFDNASGF